MMKNLKAAGVILILVGLSFYLFVGFDSATHTSKLDRKAEVDPVFPSSFVVAKEESFIRVQGASTLNPKPGEDFLFMGWFKLRRLPAQGEKITFVSKVDSSRRTRPGYAIAVSRDGDSIRPEVYWRDESGKGNWYDFISFKVPTKTWFSLALSFRGDRYLGLHSGILHDPNSRPSIELLGGYELPRGVVPHSTSDLVIGSPFMGSFRGRIGPVGIVTGFSENQQLKKVLKESFENPLGIPSSDGDVKLWVGSGAKDESSYGHSLVYKGETPLQEGKARFNPKKGVEKNNRGKSRRT